MSIKVKVDSGKIYRSTDGIIWCEVATPKGPTISSSFLINGQWIAVRSDGSVIGSSDSIVWAVAAPL